jgi:curved DNA-binding protein CbpA
VNHYELLGVPPGADTATIRRAYLALARRHHPDLHAESDAVTQNRSRRMMQDVNRAWAVLGDAGRRRLYDEQLRLGTVDRPSGAPTSAPPPGQGWRPRSDDTGWMDDFDSWKHETEELPPDVPGPRRSNPLAVVPVLLFLGGVGVGCIALVLQSRPLITGAFILVLISALLFVVLPMFAMTSRGGRGG